MASEDNNSASDVLNQGANSAKMFKNAMQAGKTAASVSKGAAVGRPYGAIAAGLWENRHLVGKIIAAMAFLLLLPILFVLMLPTLIFGDINSSAIPVMNDNSAIMANISDFEAAVRDILNEAHEKVLADIESAKSSLSDGSETATADPYADDIFFNIDLIISQYCASKDNYEDIKTNDLKQVVSAAKDNLFTFTSATETVTKKDEDSEDITVTKVTYTVEYAGDDYFADNVFRLTDEQKMLVADYASNLNTFLNDDYNNQSALLHNSLSGLTGTYPYEWTDDGFNSPFAGMEWQSHITSGFGSRIDPITGAAGAFHSGIDIAYPKGTPIHAAKSGVVVVSEKKATGSGYRIVINHGGGYSTLYGHCSELLANVGNTVNAGDVIAKVGTTGRSTGNHLHFEIIFNGNVINPMDFIG